MHDTVLVLSILACMLAVPCSGQDETTPSISPEAETITSTLATETAPVTSAQETEPSTLTGQTSSSTTTTVAPTQAAPTSSESTTASPVAETDASTATTVLPTQAAPTITESTSASPAAQTDSTTSISPTTETTTISSTTETTSSEISTSSSSDDTTLSPMTIADMEQECETQISNIDKRSLRVINGTCTFTCVGTSRGFGFAWFLPNHFRRNLKKPNGEPCGSKRECLDGKCYDQDTVNACTDSGRGTVTKVVDQTCKMECQLTGGQVTNVKMNKTDGTDCNIVFFLFRYPGKCKHGDCRFN